MSEKSPSSNPYCLGDKQEYNLRFEYPKLRRRLLPAMSGNCLLYPNVHCLKLNAGNINVATKKPIITDLKSTRCFMRLPALNLQTKFPKKKLDQKKDVEKFWIFIFFD